jgi:hypothetical protein
VAAAGGLRDWEQPQRAGCPALSDLRGHPIPAARTTSSSSRLMLGAGALGASRSQMTAATRGQERLSAQIGALPDTPAAIRITTIRNSRFSVLTEYV